MGLYRRTAEQISKEADTSLCSVAPPTGGGSAADLQGEGAAATDQELLPRCVVQGESLSGTSSALVTEP